VNAFRKGRLSEAGRLSLLCGTGRKCDASRQEEIADPWHSREHDEEGWKEK
jgi:hypothetical protein